MSDTENKTEKKSLKSRAAAEGKVAARAIGYTAVGTAAGVGTVEVVKSRFGRKAAEAVTDAARSEATEAVASGFKAGFSTKRFGFRK